MNIEIEPTTLASIEALCDFVLRHRHDAVKAVTADEIFDASLANLEAKHNAERVTAWLRRTNS